MICLFFSNFDGKDTDYDQTSVSHFRVIIENIKSVEWQNSTEKLQKDILIFYSEIV